MCISVLSCSLMADKWMRCQSLLVSRSQTGNRETCFLWIGNERRKKTERWNGDSINSCDGKSHTQTPDQSFHFVARLRAAGHTHKRQPDWERKQMIDLYTFLSPFPTPARLVFGDFFFFFFLSDSDCVVTFVRYKRKYWPVDEAWGRGMSSDALMWIARHVDRNNIGVISRESPFSLPRHRPFAPHARKSATFFGEVI